MKVAVLSDIHSNIDALSKVIEDATLWGAELFLVAGDIVGYGAAPDECIALLGKIGAKCVGGNHDWGLIDRTSIQSFNKAAQEAIRWTRENISPDARKYLEALPLTLDVEDISLAHANFVLPEGWDYVFTLDQVRSQFDSFPLKIGIIGHSHLPFITRVVQSEGWAEQVRDDSVKLVDGVRFLVNDGSVGQPRDGDPRACYLRIDFYKQVMNLRRVLYDIARAKRRIHDAGLPSSLAERLSVGR